MTYTEVWDHTDAAPSTTSVLRDADQAHIPFDDGNRDYQEYKSWLGQGNTPNPAVPPASPPKPATGAPTDYPVISGTQIVGNTLTCSTGVWANSPTGFAYQWLRDSVLVNGANANTYPLVDADHYTLITCIVTASNGGGSASMTSLAYGPIGP